MRRVLRASHQIASLSSYERDSLHYWFRRAKDKLTGTRTISKTGIISTDKYLMWVTGPWGGREEELILYVVGDQVRRGVRIEPYLMEGPLTNAVLGGCVQSHVET